MDLPLELVRALRDAAGLNWGGTDLGGSNSKRGQSGDFMRFDTRSIRDERQQSINEIIRGIKAVAREDGESDESLRARRQQRAGELLD